MTRNRLLIGIAAAILLAGGLVIAAVLNWPFTRQRLIDALQESSVRTVTLGNFRQTWFPPGCVAENVNFLHRRHKEKPPLISIQKLVVEGSYWGLIGSPKRLARVQAIGLHVTVPPRNPDGSSPVMPLTNVKSARPIVIGTIEADGAQLDFVSKTGEKTFDLVVDQLTLNGIGDTRPISYHAKIANSDPPGEIESSGRFGPWNSDDPGRTALEGTYRYDHANLGFYKGLSGVLNATGKFSGELDRTRVTGLADVPDFHVVHSAHTMHVTSNFDATVNATDGNVALDRVESQINRTMLVVTGSVEGHKGTKGKTVLLDVAAHNGRVEDLVDLFVAAKRPPMTGLINLKAKVKVPPGHDPLLEKLAFDGDFGISAGAFTDKGVEDSIRKLAASGAKGGNKGNDPDRLPTALANLKGHVTARNGIATLQNISFTIPDADAEVHGSYNLQNENVDLHGTLRTSGKVSAATDGFKSVLLRALTPFLKHQSHQTFVPFKITGTYPDADISLDLFAKK